MNAYRTQERVNGNITTIVSNNANFVKGKPGEPVLISWDDATTMFHEFGHALHGLNSNVTYPSLSGTAVARDYVEFPSQLLEHWLSTPEVLQRFALHYQTGKPIPQELVDKIKRSATFNQGFATVEYLSAALIDMKLHLAGDKKIDPDAFERETLAQLGMPKEIVMRHRTPQFLHIFSSDSYSAGYTATSGPTFSQRMLTELLLKEKDRTIRQSLNVCASTSSQLATRSIRRKLIVNSAAAIRRSMR